MLKKMIDSKSNVSIGTMKKLVLLVQFLSFLKDGNREVIGFSIPCVHTLRPNYCCENSASGYITYKHSTVQRNGKQQRLSSLPSLFLSATASTSKKDQENISNKKPSIGESIQNADSVFEMLEVASMLWLPTDDNLAPHLKTQAIHHEKRQRWASQLIVKLGSSNIIEVIQKETTSKEKLDKVGFWKDERLARAVYAASYSYSDVAIDKSDSRDNEHESISVKESKIICDTLIGIHALAGKVNADSPDVHPQIVEGIQLLLYKAEQIAPTLSLRDTTQVRWAARGILTRLVPKLIFTPFASENFVSFSDNNEHFGVSENITTSRKDLETCLKQKLPRLEKKVSFLPFDIIPRVVNWKNIVSSTPSSTQTESEATITDQLRSVIPFQFDTITTRTGSLVTERRGTAWLAEDGIGALAYSGKLMPPNELSPLVQNVMREIETVILDNDYDDSIKTNYFDCALCNYYPDEESACKFHTDPEHGTFWERLTCVVAAGEERRFAFRPIAGITTWKDHDPNSRKNTPISDNNYQQQKNKNGQTNNPGRTKKNRNGNRRKSNKGGYVKNQNYSAKQFDDKSKNSSHPNSEATSPAVIHLFEGDVVKMWGKCNDDFYHAVYTAEYGFDERIERDGRVSLVLKRAIDRGRGKKGHGIRGEGRRQKRSRYDNR